MATIKIRFRNTIGYVTDPNDVWTSVEVGGYFPWYPKVLTNGNAAELTTGYVVSVEPGCWDQTVNDNTGWTNLEGKHSFVNVSAPERAGYFRVNLPQAGSYKVRMASGNGNSYPTNAAYTIRDGVAGTSLLTYFGNQAETKFYDVLGNEYDSAALWSAGNVQSSALNFSTGVFCLYINLDGVTYKGACLRYLEIEEVPAGVTSYRLYRRQALPS